MFLMHKPTKTIVEILTLDALFNPSVNEVTARMHAGQELQDPDIYLKSEMMFLSGEALPLCWLDLHYRDTLEAKMIKEMSLVTN
ncbi:hypothetical protein NIES4101_77740 [Calothrix sp. NIES-4101]|uniref:acetyltransferase n=1 Tax=Calothrix sp. UHCC 0171 TaxID=3110245 RepID=UPI000B61EF54|nr:acetyltransferase [Calothrix sp. UHCC 0171]MEA5572268.1 acetyltransferase [Calothrix sp. UHCC 0171]BAZ41806.1 hypothetical protein NIES4101_77740 [Calothrix sp. NIES-4101]